MKVNVPFKPKAQLLLQLGEQLIKSESVAILELIKNSYDADSSEVEITMNDIDNPSIGTIEITDNGFGMDFDTVKNVWMEPGNTHKKDVVRSSQRSALGRLPIGEKGIGRFGVHKLGKKIEMITRAKDCKEVYVSIDWRSFDNAQYLEDVKVFIEERTPEYFINEKTGTRLFITDLSVSWTRGMLRSVHRSITSLSSPFVSISEFRVRFKTNKAEWLEGLLQFGEIKQYALYTGHVEIEGKYITELNYEFSPFELMAGLKGRNYCLSEPIKILKEEKIGRKKVTKEIDLGDYQIGKIKIDLLVFDRDSSITSRFIGDKRTYGNYLDENGGVRVFRDGVRIYDYGELGNDWLGLDSKRINIPGKFLSNNLVLGAVQLERDRSTDLKEKANREGFIENEAFVAFKEAVCYAINLFTTQRNIDKESLRVYLSGGKKEPIVDDVSSIRKRIATCIPDEKARREVDGYLKRIEEDFEYVKKMYLKTATAGMSYGVVIHEIEKIISELDYAVKNEKTSNQIVSLTRHLSRLVDSYAELLRNRSKSENSIVGMVKQAIFSIQYRLEAHQIHLTVDYEEDFVVNCAANLIVGSIINIIDNSIWWTTYAGVPQRKIYIKVTNQLSERPAIIIADNGCGFTLSPEDAIKPFVSNKSSGMGLGLNIVNEVMISQGGLLAFPSIGDVVLPEEYKRGAIVALVFKER